MRGFNGFILATVFTFYVTCVYGQTSSDLPKLNGSIADTSIAHRLLTESNGLIVAQKFDLALLKLDTARQIFLRTLGKNNLLYSDCLNQEGLAFFNKQRNDQALEKFRESAKIRELYLRDDHPDLASSYHNLGNSLAVRGETDLAIEYLYKALKIRTASKSVSNVDIAKTYSGLGNCFRNKSDYDSSILYQEKALELLLPILGPNHLNIAKTYGNISTCYTGKGDFKRALEYNLKAMNIFNETKDFKNPFYPFLLNQAGIVFREKGEYQKSIEYITKANDLQTQISGLVNYNSANFLGQLGTTYQYLGQHDKAIELHQKVLDITKKLFGDKNVLCAIPLVNIGNSYNELYEFETAKQYFKLCEELHKNNYPENDIRNALIYSNLATSYQGLGRYDSSLYFINKSLQLYRSQQSSDKKTITQILNNLGHVLILKGDISAGIDTLKEALSYQNLGADGNLLSTDQFFTSTQKIGYAYYLNWLSTAANNDLIQSNKYYNIAIDTFKAIRKSGYSLEAKYSFMQKYYGLFEGAISNNYLMGNTQKSQDFSQRMFEESELTKSVILNENLNESSAIKYAGIADSLLQKEQDLRVNISWQEKQRQTLLDKGYTETDSTILHISSKIFDQKRNYEALKKRFEKEKPEYYRLKYDLSTVSLQYLQRSLLQPKNQALLEYFVGDSNIYLFVIRPDTLIVQEVKRDFPLEDWIEKFRQGLYGYYTADKGKRDTTLFNSTVRQYTEYGQKLHQKLFAPVEKWLPKQVIIVPDGPLGYIPFDALLSSKPEDPLEFKSYPYLLNKYQFSYTYSATLLKEMRDKKHHQEPVKEFAAFAPFYNGDTTLLAGMYQYDELMRKDLQPLAYSGPEVAAASKLMRGEIVAGPAATEERFTSTAGDYRILHLATHGRADNRVGDYAFLAFSELKDSIENELLYVKDLYNLELNADLVVLSACETGIGKLQRGEGIISLARAFAYAGAKSIVTTLWEVNDKSTSELMRYFYRELKLGKDKDEALRLARQRYFDKAAPRGLHPFFWAAFVPVGDMRPLR